MTEIDLTISLWGRERRVEVSAVFGACGIYHIYVDRFLHGQIFQRQGRFVIEYNVGCDLCGDDLQGLFDVLEDENKKPL